MTAPAGSPRRARATRPSRRARSRRLRYLLQSARADADHVSGASTTRSWLPDTALPAAGSERRWSSPPTPIATRTPATSRRLVMACRAPDDEHGARSPMGDPLADAAERADSVEAAVTEKRGEGGGEGGGGGGGSGGGRGGEGGGRCGRPDRCGRKPDAIMRRRGRRIRPDGRRCRRPSRRAAARACSCACCRRRSTRRSTASPPRR